MYVRKRASPLSADMRRALLTSALVELACGGVALYDGVHHPIRFLVVAGVLAIFAGVATALLCLSAPRLPEPPAPAPRPQPGARPPAPVRRRRRRRR